MKRLRGNAFVWLLAVGVIWFVVVIEIVMVGFFADPPATAWIGLGIPVLVALVLSLVAIVLLRHERPSAPLPPQQRAPRSPDAHRILVVANETLAGASLQDAIRERAHGQATEVLVVAPALTGALEHWTDEEDAARAQARERLEATCASLRGPHIEVAGEVGADDPLLAIQDALRLFGADEIIISTHPPGRSNWLEEGVVDRAREFYEIPITHFVVDPEGLRDLRAGNEHANRPLPA